MFTDADRRGLMFMAKTNLAAAKKLDEFLETSATVDDLWSALVTINMIKESLPHMGFYLADCLQGHPQPKQPSEERHEIIRQQICDLSGYTQAQAEAIREDLERQDHQ